MLLSISYSHSFVYLAQSFGKNFMKNGTNRFIYFVVAFVFLLYFTAGVGGGPVVDQWQTQDRPVVVVS